MSVKLGGLFIEETGYESGNRPSSTSSSSSLSSSSSSSSSSPAAPRRLAPFRHGAVYQDRVNLGLQVHRRRETVWRSWEVRGLAEDIGKVLFSHESRILTPGGGNVSPGGDGPPASPPKGHLYHPATHSPPLVKVKFFILFFPIG